MLVSLLCLTVTVFGVYILPLGLPGGGLWLMWVSVGTLVTHYAMSTYFPLPADADYERIIDRWIYVIAQAMFFWPIRAVQIIDREFCDGSFCQKPHLRRLEASERCDQLEERLEALLKLRVHQPVKECMDAIKKAKQEMND